MFGNRARDNALSVGIDQGSETRADYRAETLGLVATVHSPQGEFTANILNLSTRGLMASASNPPLAGDRIEIRIDGVPAVHGQVRWVKDMRFGVLLFSALPVSAFRVADQGRGRRSRPPRHIVRIPVRIEAPGIVRSATIHNVSQSGVALETGLPISPGKLLTLFIEGLPPMEGRVRWSRGSRCGILLNTPLEPQVLEQLTQIR